MPEARTDPTLNMALTKLRRPLAGHNRRPATPDHGIAAAPGLPLAHLWRSRGRRLGGDWRQRRGRPSVVPGQGVDGQGSDQLWCSFRRSSPPRLRADGAFEPPGDVYSRRHGSTAASPGRGRLGSFVARRAVALGSPGPQALSVFESPAVGRLRPVPVAGASLVRAVADLAAAQSAGMWPLLRLLGGRDGFAVDEAAACIS